MALTGGVLLVWALGARSALGGWAASVGLTNAALVGGLLLLAGIVVLVARGRRAGAGADERTFRLALFGGSSTRPASTDFRRGALVAVFGGLELDLRDSETQQEQLRIDVVTLFGGTHIRVPKHWRTTVTGVPVFGGFDVSN